MEVIGPTRSNCGANAIIAGVTSRVQSATALEKREGSMDEKSTARCLPPEIKLRHAILFSVVIAVIVGLATGDAVTRRGLVDVLIFVIRAV